MITLDTTKKTQNTTYFLFPMYLSSLLEEIFNASNEEDYKIYSRTMLKQVVPAELIKENIQFDPDDKHTEPWRRLNVCVSTYDPAYLKKSLLTQWKSDEETRKAKMQANNFSQTVKEQKIVILTSTQDENNN